MNPQADRPGVTNFSPDCRVIGLMYAGRDAEDEDDYVFIACNSHWETHDIEIPDLGNQYKWQVIVNTFDEHSIAVYRQEIFVENHVQKLPPRTVQILLAKKIFDREQDI